MPALLNTHALADAAGKTLAAVLAPLGPLRDAKPLHPDGTVLQGRLEVTDPATQLAVPLFAERKNVRCMVRISRAVGLPAPLPDIGGIALRLSPDAPLGSQADLLFASTGTGRLTRWLLLPHLRPDQKPQTTLLPAQSVSGPVLFALTPEAALPGPSTAAYRLLWARPGGDWNPLGRLALEDPVAPTDPPLRFDPIENPVPGLSTYPAVRRLREPAYAAARRLWPRRGGHRTGEE